MRIPRSGITFDHELEWRLAARWNNYRWTDFRELPPGMQEELIAVYRLSIMIDSALAWDANKKANRAPKGGRPRVQ